MKKKLLSLLLAFAFGAGMCVQASVIASGTCGDNLTWEVTTTGYLDMYRALTIIGTGEMTDFTVSNEAPWANYTSAMTSITLPEGLTTIGDRAFFYCTSVQEITIPSSVTRIGMQSFSRCDKLTNIDLPDGLKVLRDGAFSRARGLVSLTIPANVNHIGFGITDECLKLQSITVDKANTTFDSRNDCNAIIRTATNTLLAGCYNTIIPNTVDTIGIQAFSFLPLPAIVIPEGVEQLENYAFADSKPENATLHIPASVKMIGYCTFMSNSFTSITVDSGNEIFESPTGSNAIIEKATKTLVIGCPATVIPEGTLAIKEAAFYALDNLKSIVIPASVKYIGTLAFCFTGLTQLTCKASTPPTLESSSVFSNVNKTIPIYVPKASVEAYKVAAGWDYFTNYIGIGEEEQTFEPCSSEMQGTCGENLKWLITCDGELVITGSGAMNDYSIMDDEPKAPWESYKSNFYNKITSVIANSGVTTIGNYALYGCSYATNISLPEGLTRIGMGGICVCPEITSLTLPSTLAEIERNAFMSCPKLTTLTIPASVEQIDAPIFDGYTKITTLSVETGNKRYDSRNGCNAIIETNTNTLVQGCIATVIPDNITTIGDYAFQYNAFTSVTIPSSVKTIASSAFMGCSQLTEITCEAVNPPAIEESWTAFYDVNHDIPVYVPQGSIDAYKKAAVWKEFTNIKPIEVPFVSDLNVFGITVDESNYADILGDGKASYNSTTNTLTLKNLVIDFSKSSYTNSAIQYFGKEEQFTIEIVGRCEFINMTDALAGINHDSGELIIKGGELLITGVYTAIHAYRVTIDACNVTAKGKYEYVPAIVASEQLKVTNNAHILAINSQEIDYPDDIEWGYPAIATLNTVFDENINILTPGVHFYRKLEPIQWPGMFYTDEANTVMASEVEIGKGATVVPEDQQTTISFDDPENAEAAIFSASANDYYNADEDRLEISSTLTDAQVASALETLIPGSSAWVEALPGSIIFDVPAGKGEITIECMTLPGYELKLKVAGQEAISITQTSIGKAKVNYNVVVPTHVVIYLHGGSSPAPARIATNAQDANGAGAYIKSITINPDKSTPEPCTESRQGTCGENLNWLITCEGELVITGSGAMTDFSYSNSAPWTAYLSEIKSVSLPDGLTHIGAWSIYQIPNIESVVIPEGVKSIGYVGFAGCRNLKSVTLPNSLETIGSMCFQSAALQTLFIPANVASIGEGITEECEALLSIVVSEDNSTFDSREGCNAIIKTANNTLIAGCKTTIIPNTVTAIGNFAFSSNHNVENIKIPNSVESIGNYAFQYCSGFKNLVIPTSVTSISGTAFTGCAFATIKVIPGNPKFDSRDNCNAIIETATKKLIKGSEFTVMPDGITAFGEGAFMSNRNLKFINIPATVESLEKNALIYCNNLKAITSLATVPPAAADLAFNYGATSSISIDPSIPVYVPGASIEAYKAAKNWSYFTNFVALDGYYTIKALATHGKVTGTGTYAANTTIELNAIPDEGFAFLEWTDGTTANPKELIVTKDETVRALFKMLDVEEEVAELSYQSDRMIITWDEVDAATIYIVNLYKGGVLLATYKTTDYVNFIELETYAPAPMRARRNFADEQPGKISFSIEGLEYGADYSYSIDAYDANEEVVNVIAGSFNTAEIPTDASAVNSQANAPRKMLNDGKLFIQMPDGKSYDATGVQLK